MLAQSKEDIAEEWAITDEVSPRRRPRLQRRGCRLPGTPTICELLARVNITESDAVAVQPFVVSRVLHP